MSKEDLDGLTGVDLVVRGLKASFITTQFTSDRLTADAVSINDPEARREAFEAVFAGFEEKPMADPLIYKPAILDAYGELDDFSLGMIRQDHMYVVQDILARMENPRMIGSLLTKIPYGMIHWPGFSEYKWVIDISWEEFEANAIRRSPDGLNQELIKVNPDIQGKGLFSRLWFSYATLRSDYYNPDFNRKFDETFPQWREASLVLDAMLLDREDRDSSVDRISKRGHYILDIIPYMQNGAAKQDIETLIAANPQIVHPK